jgi:hypothetical protein
MTNDPQDSETSDKPGPDRPLTRLELGPIVLPYEAPDFNDLEDEMLKRLGKAIDHLQRLSASHEEPWLFLTPVGAVVSIKPTAAFFRSARKMQRRWSKQCSAVFPRGYRRKIGEFWSPNVAYSDDRKKSRTENFVLHGLCVRGLMIRNGVPLAPHDWNRAEKQVLSRK